MQASIAISSWAVAIAACFLTGQLMGQDSLPETHVRSNLTFRIVIRYPESQLTDRGLTTDLFIVGNGLGLAWNETTLLTKADQPDTWTIDLNFQASIDGFSCEECTNDQKIPVGSNFEYRIMTSDNTDMIGINFAVSLPLSKVEKRFPVRQYEAYPHFFTKRGTIRAINVTSSDDFIKTREWAAYLPPSFDENTYKKYPTAIAFDMSTFYMTFLRLYIEQNVVTYGVASEMVVIGSGDYQLMPNSTDDDRTELLTPVPGAGFACKEGTYSDNCNGCIPEGTPPREYQEMMRDGCGIPIFIGGKGERYLDHVVNEVLPDMQTYSENRLLLDRDNLGIGGCSLGGWMACHALWTRSEIFSFGSCQSASFFRPMVDHTSLDNGFEFLNKTLKTFNGPRLPQTIYIDVGGLEVDPYKAFLQSAVEVYDAIATASPQFRKDENLFLVIAENEGHCDLGAMGRSWLWASVVKTPPGRRNPNPPL